MLGKVEFKEIFQGTEKALPHQKFQKTRGQGSSGGNGDRESRVGTEADRKDVRQDSKDKPVVKRRGKNCSQISEK